MTTVGPLIGTFGFFSILFGVGKLFQWQERKDRKRRAEALKTRAGIAATRFYFEEHPTAAAFAGPESARAASAGTATQGWNAQGRA